MTHSEIRAQSFNQLVGALSEVFPNIPHQISGDILCFDNGSVYIEMQGCDQDAGYFDVRHTEGSFGTLWGVKAIVNVVVREICNVRRRKVLRKFS